MKPGDLARLRLIRTRSIGPVAYAQLIARFGSAEAALDALPDLARRGGGRAVAPPPIADIVREAEAVDRFGARYLFRGQGLYPRLLAEIEAAPPAIVAKGDLTLLDRPAVAMVGARNASAAAGRFARQLAHDLGADKMVVVSGLARGIDTAAHAGSIDQGTIAVIAGGLDIFYPPENEALQRAIGERGVVIAEMPPGTEPRARHFPYRNRIIAGIGRGTIVVEAAPRSGSLITARYAADYGREVMAVPGSPLDPRAQGCNLLIREGATLIQSAADVLESLGTLTGLVREPAPRAAPLAPIDAGDAERRAVTDLLGNTPVPVDELVRQSGVPAAAVQTVLLELELAGRLERHAGNRVALG
ncbi:DNA-processing protein DprA [Sphingomonas naphthae]|uniref:DNA-processing protein DprA n=1 Tax=Sphingomonas naphthae TaxID=1813468 RepID=A0ABY7TLG7_9SPHN|nr:DNA-processing protein DprA [Sphingomonas naphthae]WCT73821.1 DNA-processing protein DprA [Sphingomonas naphthae]